MTKTMKKAISVFLAIAVALSVSVSSALVFDAVFRDESTFALSKFGSTGSEVRKIQNKLKELGYYYDSVDGVYGTNTKNAVTRFQKNCGITADGICGQKTLLYLGLGGSSSSGNNTGFTNADVELLAKVISAEARGESYEVRLLSVPLF